MERTTAFKSLNNDLERSSQCFAIYRKYARRPESKETWTRRVLSTAVADALNTQQCICGRGEESLKALGVGSGSGEVEYWMLSELQTSFPKITNLSIEPSAEELSKYHQYVAANKSKLEGISFEWYQQTLRAYRQSNSEKSSESGEDAFHVITAFHSLYYEPNLESVLQYLYDRLAKRGVLIVALDSDNDGFGRLRCQLPLAWDDNYHYCSANHVKTYFDRQNIPYTVLRRPSQVDVTPCFSQCRPTVDENTEVPLQAPESGDGAMLLDFIFQVAEFHQSVQLEKQDELLRFLRSICTVTEGKMLLQCDTEYVFVPNNS